MVQWSFLVVSPTRDCYICQGTGAGPRKEFLKGLFIEEWTGLSEPGKEQPSISGKLSSLGPGAQGEEKQCT